MKNIIIRGLPVKEIGFDAFNKRKLSPDFSAVVIPEGVEIISTQAFFEQEVLVAVVLPSSLKSIDNSAFSGNRKLTTIKLPENLMKIGPQAFSETGLTSIDLPEGLLVIEDSAFAFTSLTTVTLPKSLKVLNEYAFGCCDNLTEINIPAGLSVAANIDTNYKDGKFCFGVDTKSSITFAKIFSGEKIKESLALQKKLQEHKTVKPGLYDATPVSKWNW